jgi:hypothetical protein
MEMPMPMRSRLKSVEPDRHRLRQVLELVPTIPQNRLNMATYYAVPRTLEIQPVGCMLGHFARSGGSPLISLKPINFCSELKSPLMADVLLDEFPLKDWQHYTLHYQSRECEAFGLTAAMIYVHLREWDTHRLFYPAGSSYEIRPPLESLTFRLRQFVETWPYAAEIGDHRGDQIAGDD